MSLCCHNQNDFLLLKRWFIHKTNKKNPQNILSQPLTYISVQCRPQNSRLFLSSVHQHHSAVFVFFLFIFKPFILEFFSLSWSLEWICSLTFSHHSIIWLPSPQPYHRSVQSLLCGTFSCWSICLNFFFTAIHLVLPLLLCWLNQKNDFWLWLCCSSIFCEWHSFTQPEVQASI